MFDFLKKKFKKFENALEQEVEKTEVAEETERDRQVEEKVESELEKQLELEKKLGGDAEATGKKLPMSEKKLDELLWELEVGLLEADVALPVVEDIKKTVKRQLPAMARRKPGEAVRETLKQAIANILSSADEDFWTFIEESKKPVVLMFVGVNGTGKTTSIAKMVHQLQQRGYTAVMGACDTFRAGAIEQLQQHADNLDVKLIKHDIGSDPAAVAYDAVQHAKAKYKDVVLLDTAGRMQTNVNLMDEMKKIRRVAEPDKIIFVGDALTGNDAVEQAKRFNQVVPIDGTILNKVDADAKGGAALSIAYTIGKPLLFIGNGQEYDDQIVFTPEWMLQRLFD